VCVCVCVRVYVCMRHWPSIQDNPGEPAPEINICSLTPTLKPNFHYLVQSTASSLFSCRIRQSSFYNLSPGFLGVPLGLTPALHNPCTFSPNPFFIYVHTISTYFAITP